MNTCKSCRHWGGREENGTPSRKGECHIIGDDEYDVAARGVHIDGVYGGNQYPRLMTPPGFGCILYSREFDRRGHPIGSRKPCTWGCDEGMYSRPDGSAFPCNHCEGTGYLPEARDGNV